ncbi:MAG: hypothetical protein IPO13_14915 [Rhodocyclaceae bacterium]|nr:hypothetical protein [Rhodocyclaceae bacterium]
MSTAKPRYDGDGSWKNRKFTETEWDRLGGQIRKQLRPYYPDKKAKSNHPFGHPADGFANAMLAEANTAVSIMLWLGRRLTKEELHAEQLDAMKVLKRAEYCLDNLSHDFDIMLGVDADILGCRDQIRALIPRIEAAKATISKLPRAKKLSQAQADASVEMAIRVLRVWKGYGGSVTATADMAANAGRGQVSDSVKILKILGDALGLCLAEKTWVASIAKARRKVSDL